MSVRFRQDVRTSGGMADTTRLGRVSFGYCEFDSRLVYGRLAERLLHSLARGAPERVWRFESSVFRNGPRYGLKLPMMLCPLTVGGAALTCEILVRIQAKQPVVILTIQTRLMVGRQPLKLEIGVRFPGLERKSKT